MVQNIPMHLQYSVENNIKAIIRRRRYVQFIFHIEDDRRHHLRNRFVEILFSKRPDAKSHRMSLSYSGNTHFFSQHIDDDCDCQIHNTPD